MQSWKRLLGLVALFGLILSACGDDDDVASVDPNEVIEEDDLDTETEDDAPDDEDAPASDEDAPASVDPLAVTAVDFGYEGLPDSVAAGTAIELFNDSDSELHEFVAVRLPDDEERSVGDLLQLPPEELEQQLLPGLATVVVTLPGETNVPGAVEGDGTLTEPGRYAIICFIPTGVDPQVYLDAAAEAEEGPPQVEGAGPPHFTQGMFAELIVE